VTFAARVRTYSRFARASSQASECRSIPLLLESPQFVSHRVFARENVVHNRSSITFRVFMNPLSWFVSRIVFAGLAALLIAGCSTAPPNPAGIIQAWPEPPNVRLLRNGRTLSIIHPMLPNVERWRLLQNDTAIVIKSRGIRNQPAAIELFDVSTGALIGRVMSVTLYTGQPAWARGFQD
jgi:hypothetical protein